MKPKYTDADRYANGYRSAVDTDIKATFRRIRAEQKAKDAQTAANAAEAARVVAPLKRTG